MKKPSKSIFQIYREEYKNNREEKRARISFYRGRNAKFETNVNTRPSILEEMFRNKGQDYTTGYLSNFNEYASFPEHTGDLIVDYVKLRLKKRIEKLPYTAATNIWSKYYSKPNFPITL